jgi:hypothetical protein
MKRCLWFLPLLFAACSHSAKTTVHIRLDGNKLIIEFTGLDPSVTGEIQRDSGAWQNIFPIYRMPADTDMKDYQRPQPGRYRLSRNVLTFTPDTAFIKGQTYFLRDYEYGEGKSTWDLFKHKQKLGSLAYIDLSFKK